jgi:hypothetical protein
MCDELFENGRMAVRGAAGPGWGVGLEFAPNSFFLRDLCFGHGGPLPEFDGRDDVQYPAYRPRVLSGVTTLISVDGDARCGYRPRRIRYLMFICNRRIPQEGTVTWWRWCTLQGAAD